MQVTIDNLSEDLTRCPHFGLLRTLCKDIDAYIVGGAVRDALLGLPISDLDLIAPLDPTALAKTFARQIKGHWFWLDEERRQSRVVLNMQDLSIYYDFALFRASGLQEDLLDRDFTINALALSLGGDLTIDSLIDPCNGLEDLRQDTLRMISQDSFSNDPLRILKGLRHSTALCLQIDAATLQAMIRDTVRLGEIAPERIRKEIWRILEDSQAARGLQLLGRSGAGEFLFGSGYTPAIPNLLTTLKVCRDNWQKMASDNSVISDWLLQEVEQGLRRETLLLMVFLLRKVSPELPVFLAKSWSLSRKSMASISALSRLDEQMASALSTVARNERAYAWWANSCQVEPKLLLLAIAAVCTKGAEDIPDSIHTWVPLVNSMSNTRPTELIDGHWLNQELSIKRGPEMSKALEMVRNAEITGEVDGCESAKDFLFKHYQNKH